jgi:hypothetical protein
MAVLYVLLATGFATATANALHNRSNAVTISSAHLVSFGPQAKYLVLIVLDGARPDYFGLTRLPNVDALRAEGVQYVNAMDGILETGTRPAIPPSPPVRRLRAMASWVSIGRRTITTTVCFRLMWCARAP